MSYPPKDLKLNNVNHGFVVFLGATDCPQRTCIPVGPKTKNCMTIQNKEVRIAWRIPLNCITCIA